MLNLRRSAAAVSWLSALFAGVLAAAYVLAHGRRALPNSTGPSHARRSPLPGAETRQASSAASHEVLFPFSVCQLRCATRCGRHPGNPASAFPAAHPTHGLRTRAVPGPSSRPTAPMRFFAFVAAPERAPKSGPPSRSGCRLSGSCIAHLRCLAWRCSAIRLRPREAWPGLLPPRQRSWGFVPFAVLVLPAGPGALTRFVHPHMPFQRSARYRRFFAGVAPVP